MRLSWKGIIPFFQPYLELEGGFFNYRNDTILDSQESPINIKYSFTYRHRAKFLKFFSLNNELSLQALSSSTELAVNELAYFGGLRTLRGFYELELVGNEVWILKNEIVFQPVEAFSIMALYDYSHFVHEGANFTHSGGLGFGLTTGNSVLEVVIANGTLNNNPFALSNTKVHIGFRSSF